MGTRGRGGVNSSRLRELEDGEVKVKILDTKGEIRFFYCGLPRVFFFFAKKLVSSKDEND